MNKLIISISLLLCMPFSSFANPIKKLVTLPSPMDSIAPKTISHITFQSSKLKYCTQYENAFTLHFTDGTKAYLNAENRAFYNKLYHLETKARYVVIENDESHKMKHEGKYIELHSTFRTKDFDGTTNEYLQISFKASHFHQEIVCAFTASASYSYDFNGGNNNFIGGASGQNVHLKIIHIINDDYSVKITPLNGTSQTVLINAKSGSIILNVKGEDGKNGLNGTDGKDASFRLVGSTFIRGQDGANGQNGQNGGSGGFVTISCPNSFKEYTSIIIVNSAGGKGGKGGKGGLGGDHQFASDEEWANARLTNTVHAHNGYPGYDGQNGQNGIVNFEFYD